MKFSVEISEKYRNPVKFYLKFDADLFELDCSIVPKLINNVNFHVESFNYLVWCVTRILSIPLKMEGSKGIRKMGIKLFLFNQIMFP